jgi:lipid A 4'-phosphatase
MSQTPMRLKSVYLLVLGASLAVAMLPVLWPRLDIAVAAYFLQPSPPVNPAQWFWVDVVNEYTPDVFRSIAIILLACWIAIGLTRRWRRAALALAFVGVSLLVGPGFATWAVKEHQLRARPFDVVEFGGKRQFTPALQQANQCSDNCAFVSGHVACGFFFASLLLLDPRRRWWWIAFGTAAGLSIGLARMSVGAHWLSDVLWAFPITLASSWLVWRVLAFFYKNELPSESA